MYTITDLVDLISVDGFMEYEYANYIMDHADSDRIICNGDTLLIAMEDEYLITDFAKTIIDDVNNSVSQYTIH